MYASSTFRNSISVQDRLLSRAWTSKLPISALNFAWNSITCHRQKRGLQGDDINDSEYQVPMSLVVICIQIMNFSLTSSSRTASSVGTLERLTSQNLPRKVVNDLRYIRVSSWLPKVPMLCMISSYTDLSVDFSM